MTNFSEWLRIFRKKNLDVRFDIVHILIKVTYNRRTLSLKSHDIEINPKQYEHYGEDAVVKLYCTNCVIITCILLVKVINIKIKILNDWANRLERLDFVTALKAINNGQIMNIIALNVMQNIYVSVKLIRIVCVADIAMEN